MTIFDYKNFYLVGIKGVAMTSLAQCLLDAKKQVGGADVPEDFVTAKILKEKNLKIDLGFDHELPTNVDCIVYSAAHQGPDNPLVKKAKAKNIPCFSQAEALANLFNQKEGIAVCGVGGKSTISAMITWILEKTRNKKEETKNLSFSIGVGDIIGLGKTGQWNEDSKYFIAEADEYVIDPKARERGEKIIPRFSFLKPKICVCSNLKFDHPDVYKDFEDTKQHFFEFFKNIKPNGYLIINQDDKELVDLATKLKEIRPDITIINYKLSNYPLNLKVPGDFNKLNAQAAITVTKLVGVEEQDAIDAIQSFQSTKRRFEFIGEKNGVLYYDDYAHHPSEIEAVTKTIYQLYPDKRVVIAFQPHTYSRTKELFDDFVNSLTRIKELVLLDIFASAREQDDPSISSHLLAEEIKSESNKIIELKNYAELTDYCKRELKPGDVLITLGAGDIYKAHNLL